MIKKILNSKYCCLYSSFVFLFNVILAYKYNYNIYALFFFMLLSTSLVHHYYKTDNTYICDQISIMLVVLYGSYLLYQKRDCNSLVLLFIISLFLSTVYLYHYGKLKKKYVFSKNIITSNKYHVLMHIIAAVGNGLVIII